MLRERVEEKAKIDYYRRELMRDGVIGNTPRFGRGVSRFESWSRSKG